MFTEPINIIKPGSNSRSIKYVSPLINESPNLSPK